MLLNGCLSQFFEIGQPECATGDTASTATVALVGDSNTTMWAPAFQQVATERHWRLEILGKAGCPLMNLPITNPHLHGSAPSVSSGAVRSSPGCRSSARGWSCSACGGTTVPTTVSVRFHVIGRIKDLLIADGRNHSPGDIEVTIQEITGASAPRSRFRMGARRSLSPPNSRRAATRRRMRWTSSASSCVKSPQRSQTRTVSPSRISFC